MYVYVYILYIYSVRRRRPAARAAPRDSRPALHPVSITRFPLRRFSPGAGLLRYVFFIGSG